MSLFFFYIPASVWHGICYYRDVTNKTSNMKYEVEITRISYATLTFGVEAGSEEEAKDLAMDIAYNTGFDEDTAEYEIDGCYETTE
jgi:hypothetical protein